MKIPSFKSLLQCFHACLPACRIECKTMGLAALMFLAQGASAQVLIDFGPNDVTNGKITSSPDVNGNYWNNMTAVANGSTITNLVTTNNAVSTVSLTLLSAFSENGILNGGLTNPSPSLLGIFAIPTATEDYFFINQTYNTAAGTVSILINGLNPTLAYNFSMFGTRNNGTIRTTTYAATDINGLHSVNLVTSSAAANSGSNTGNTAGNDKTIATLKGLVPSAAGQLTFQLIVGDSANFAYLGLMFINPTNQVPTLPVFTVQPISQTDRVTTTNTLNAYAVGALSYQWYFASAPLAGAKGTNLVLSSMDYTNAGNYYLVASNSLGYSTSSVAVVTIAPLHIPGHATLIDFGPNDVANGNITTSPDINGNYWNNMVSGPNVAQGLAITNLVTANNTKNTVGVTVSSTTWLDNGIQNGGLLNPDSTLLGDLAVPTATQDYFHLSGAGVVGTLLISGLNPALTYNLSMFGTRNTPDIRNSIYSVTDVNGAHTVTLQTSGAGVSSGTNPSDTAGNDKTIVSLNGLVPNASGQINFVTTVGAYTGSPFAYLSMLEIAFTGPTPGITVNPQSQAVAAGSTITLNGVATNTLPLNYQWYLGGAPLIGATSASLVLPSVSHTNAGSYYVVASNTLGSAASSVAVVTVTQAIPSVQSVPMAGAIMLGQTVANSTLSPGAYTNASGTPVAGTSAFVDSTIPATALGNITTSVIFTPADGVDYDNVTNTVTVLVTPQTPVLATAPTASALTYGQTLASSGLTGGTVQNLAGEILPGSFTFADSTVIPKAGNPNVQAIFTPSDLTDYSPLVILVPVSVGQAILTITANSVTKIYGQELAFEGTEFTTLGLVGGDSVTSVTLSSPGGTKTAGVTDSTYAITATAAVGSGLNNYSISYLPGALAVTPAVLGVCADDKSRVYGATNPVLTVTFTGWANGETLAASDVVGAASLTNSADTNSVVGSYVITNSIGTLASTNYSFSLTNGTLTVTVLPVTVTADAQTKTYGTVDPALTYQFSPALINGDSFTGGLSRETGDTVSGYAISQGTLALSSNYQLTFFGNALVINPAMLRITAANASKAYGQTVAFQGTEFTVVGLINNDTVTSVGLNSIGAVSTATMNTYAILAGNALGSGLTNYSITYVDGTLMVNAATPVTIKASVLPIDGNVQLTFIGGDSGVTYQVQSSTDLNASNWSTLSTIVAGPSGLPAFTDLNSTNHVAFFYRTVTP